MNQAFTKEVQIDNTTDDSSILNRVTLTEWPSLGIIYADIYTPNQRLLTFQGTPPDMISLKTFLKGGQRQTVTKTKTHG